MLFLAPKWWPTIFVPRGLALRVAGLNGERGLRVPEEGCVPLRATATSKAAGAKCCPRRHQSRSAIGSEHRRHPTTRSYRWPSPADGWLKALDFTGQGAGRPSNGAIFLSPIETRQAPTSAHQPIWPPPSSDVTAATGWKAKIMGKAGSEHKRPIQWVGACKRLNSLRQTSVPGDKRWVQVLCIGSCPLQVLVRPSTATEQPSSAAGPGRHSGQETTGLRGRRVWATRGYWVGRSSHEGPVFGTSVASVAYYSTDQRSKAL